MEKATIFDYARMCKHFDDNCQACPMFYKKIETGLSCGKFIRNCPDKANEIILKWCEEHPIKTRQDGFLKMFPNAQKLNTDILSVCPKTLDVTLDINCERPCSGCYKDYWLAEVEENE